MKEFLLEKFVEWNPDLVQRMKQTDHAFSSKYQNPHHLEGDVWSHTMLVLQKSKDNLDAIAALCHDIGKVYTRQTNNPPKVSFYNHENASIQPTIDFFTYLDKTCEFISPREREMLGCILHSISVHIDVMNALKEQNFEKFSALCDYNEFVFEDVYNLMMADKHGRFRKKGTNVDWFDNHDFNFKYLNKQTALNQCSYILFCGVPGTGKTYEYYKNYDRDYERFSFDTERIRIYNEKNKVDENLSSSELYDLAFQFVNKKNYNLLDRFEQLIRNYNTKYIIDNTNLTKKARRKVVNIIKKYKPNAKIGALFFAADSDTIFKRNKERESIDKKINEHVINKFMYNQSIPTFDEGFDCVKISY